MRLDDAPVRDLRRLLVEERRDLLALLVSLSETDWLRSTECDLLKWSGEQVDSYVGGVELSDSGSVIWAAEGSVPLWFDIARDFTAR